MTNARSGSLFLNTCLLPQWLSHHWSTQFAQIRGELCHSPFARRKWTRAHIKRFAIKRCLCGGHQPVTDEHEQHERTRGASRERCRRTTRHREHPRLGEERRRRVVSARSADATRHRAHPRLAEDRRRAAAIDWTRQTSNARIRTIWSTRARVSLLSLLEIKLKSGCHSGFQLKILFD